MLKMIALPSLGDEISHLPLFPCRSHDVLTSHALQGVANGLPWWEVERGADLLSIQTFWMIGQDLQNPLTHRPPWSASLALCWSLSRGLSSRYVAVRSRNR